MLLSQYRDTDGGIRAVARSGIEVNQVQSDETLYRIALGCAERGERLADRISALASQAPSTSDDPELLVGDLPHHVERVSRIRWGGRTLSEAPFLSTADLEHHHLGCEFFRRSGDVHVRMFGTATPSFADEVSCRPVRDRGAAVGLPLRNRLAATTVAATAPRMEIRAL